MADMLTEMYNKIVGSEDLTAFQIFQRGVTAGAVNMRERAIKITQDNNDRNTIINKIGALSDIPE